MVKQLSVMITKTIQVIATVTVSLPLLGMSFAVVWSLLFAFEQSTATHCNVDNYLPSVSAAIAMTPQAYVWRGCIALHSTPRYFFTYIYWNWHFKHIPNETKLLSPLRSVLIFLAVSANAVEISALLGLTVVSSRENFGIHEGCFIMFMIGSLTCMISSCILNSLHVMESEFERKVARRKMLVVIAYISAFILSIYFYFRHNNYCEPGVYSLFALCEYIVIICNMAFHYTVANDLREFAMTVSNESGIKLRWQ